MAKRFVDQSQSCIEVLNDQRNNLKWLARLRESVESIANFGCGKSTEAFALLWRLHAAGCGTPPRIEERPGQYLGYFENRYGEQMIFIFDRGNGTGWLYAGDAGWETPYEVVGGVVKQLILSPEEGLWLRACWEAPWLVDAILSETELGREVDERVAGLLAVWSLPGTPQGELGS